MNPYVIEFLYTALDYGKEEWAPAETHATLETAQQACLSMIARISWFRLAHHRYRIVCPTGTVLTYRNEHWIAEEKPIVSQGL